MNDFDISSSSDRDGQVLLPILRRSPHAGRYALKIVPLTLQSLEFEMPSDEGADPLLEGFADLARLYADGKLDEARVLFEKLRPTAEGEPDTVTIGPTGVVHRRRGQTVLRIIEGGVEPLPSGAIKKKIL